MEVRRFVGLLFLNIQEIEAEVTVILKERVYQIKEVMDKFGITRDTIYHYEKEGLISLRREENSYRVLDELNIQKIKKILDLRNLGFSVDEVRKYCTFSTNEKRLEMILELQKKTEEELRRTKRRLEQIHAQQIFISDSSRFLSTFNVDYNTFICVNCPYCTAEERRSFYVRDGFLIDVKLDGTFANIEECELVLRQSAPDSLCARCDQKTKEPYRRVFRGHLLYENWEQFQKSIRQAYFSAKELDYKLQKKLYVTLQVPKIEQGERLSCNVYIPMDEEN